jgi:hypothetical protein
MATGSQNFKCSPPPEENRNGVQKLSQNERASEKTFFISIVQGVELE